jgi:hypothetical protein
MIKVLKSRSTMQQTGEYFVDVVTGRIVFYWIDCYGDRWMVERKWGFRVKTD